MKKLIAVYVPEQSEQDEEQEVNNEKERANKVTPAK